MITYEMIKDAQAAIIQNWGEDIGGNVIAECAKVTPFNGNFKSFLTHCTCCGGNWGGMLLTGIGELFPNVWEAIPENMGVCAWLCIISTLILCGVDTSE